MAQTVGRWTLNDKGKVNNEDRNFTTGGGKGVSGNIWAIGPHDSAWFVDGDNHIWKSTRTIDPNDKKGRELLVRATATELQGIADSPLAPEFLKTGTDDLPNGLHWETKFFRNAQHVGVWTVDDDGSVKGEGKNFTGGFTGGLNPVGPHDEAIFVDDDGRLWKSTHTIHSTIGKEILRPLFGAELQEASNSALHDELAFWGADLPGPEPGTPGAANLPPPPSPPVQTPVDPTSPVPTNPFRDPGGGPGQGGAPGAAPINIFEPQPGQPTFPGAGGPGSLVTPGSPVIPVFDQGGVARGFVNTQTGAVSRGFFGDVEDFFNNVVGPELNNIGSGIGDFFDDIAEAFDPSAGQEDIERALGNAREALITGAEFAGETERNTINRAADAQRQGTVGAGNLEQGALGAQRDVLRGQFDLQGRTLNPVSQLGLASQEQLAARPETPISEAPTFTPDTPAPIEFTAEPESGLDFNAATSRGEEFTRDPTFGRTFDAQTQSGNRLVAPTQSGNRLVAPTQSGNRLVAPTQSGNRFTAQTDSGNRFRAPVSSGQRFAPQTDFGQTFDAPTDSGERFDPETQFSFTRDDLAEDEGFQFRLEQGQQAIDRSAAARGGLVSGRTLAASQQFGQGLAATEFDAAFRRASETFQGNFGREAAVFDRNTAEFQNEFQRQAQQFGINAAEFMNKFTREDRVFTQNEQQFADEFARAAARFGINADEFANVFNREAQKFGIQEDQFGQEFQRDAQRFGLEEDQFGQEFQRDAQRFGLEEDQFGQEFQRDAQRFGLEEDQFGQEFQRDAQRFGVNADIFAQDFGRELAGFEAREGTFARDFAREAESFDRNAAEFGANFARSTEAHDRLQQANLLDFQRQFDIFNTNEAATVKRDELRLQAGQQHINALATSAGLGQESRNLLAQLDAELSLNLSAAEAAPGLAAAANILAQAEINNQEILGLGLSASQQDIAIANARANAENAIAQARADMALRSAQFTGTVLGASLGFGFDAVASGLGALFS